MFTPVVYRSIPPCSGAATSAVSILRRHPRHRERMGPRLPCEIPNSPAISRYVGSCGDNIAASSRGHAPGVRATAARTVRCRSALRRARSGLPAESGGGTGPSGRSRAALRRARRTSARTTERTHRAASAGGPEPSSRSNNRTQTACSRSPGSIAAPGASAVASARTNGRSALTSWAVTATASTGGSSRSVMPGVTCRRRAAVAVRRHSHPYGRRCRRAHGARTRKSAATNSGAEVRGHRPCSGTSTCGSYGSMSTPGAERPVAPSGACRRARTADRGRASVGGHAARPVHVMSRTRQVRATPGSGARHAEDAGRTRPEKTSTLRIRSVNPMCDQA